MAEMNMNPREKARLEEEKKNRKTRNKFILVGVIVVLMIALVIFVNSRLFYNVTTALTIGDTNYSVARMNYEYQKAYMNFNQTYGQYFGSLIDTSKSLKEQSCPFDANGGTWDDYFKQSAETNLTQLSAVYAKAIAEGYALTEDEAAEIDTAVESYRTYGKSIGFATLNKFLSAYFGTGNSEKTIRANMAEELIASRYADDVYASFTYTDDEIDAYYAENADSYDRVNVLYTLISAAANEDEGIDADTAKAAAEDKAKDATERTARLQADWENFRRRTANERIAERERATEKLVTALLPVIDDIERAIDHARSQDLSDDFKQFVDGVDAVHAKLLDVFAHEGVEPIDPKGEAFDPLEHQAVGRVEDASQYDETVNDVYQKGYRMADRILRSAMVTVTYGGEKRPAPEPEAAPEDATADTVESTEE